MGTPQAAQRGGPRRPLQPHVRAARCSADSRKSGAGPRTRADAEPERELRTAPALRSGSWRAQHGPLLRSTGLEKRRAPPHGGLLAGIAFGERHGWGEAFAFHGCFSVRFGFLIMCTVF